MKKLLKKIDKEKIDKVILKIPYIFILLVVILLSPLGVYCLVTKVSHEKRKLYHNKRLLLTLGLFIIFLIGVGIYKKIQEIISLCSSGMSLDMINFFPKNLHLYIIGIIMATSYIIGAVTLKKYAKIERVYTKLINIECVTSIEKISTKLNIPVNEVKANIRRLMEKSFLLPIMIDDNKNTIIYSDKKKKKSTKKLLKNKDKLIKCPKCGAFVYLKEDEYVECDLCGNGLIELDSE